METRRSNWTGDVVYGGVEAYVKLLAGTMRCAGDVVAEKEAQRWKMLVP